MDDKRKRMLYFVELGHFHSFQWLELRWGISKNHLSLLATFIAFVQMETSSKMLSSTIQKDTAIIKRRTLVVVQHTTLPDFPGCSIFELWYWPVK